MSVLGKKSFVEKVLESCSSQELETFRSLINSIDSGVPTHISLNPLSSNFISNSNKGVSHVSFQLNELLNIVIDGILVYNSSYCALFSNSNFNSVSEWNIDIANHRYDQVYENLTAEELRQVTNDLLGGGGSVSPSAIRNACFNMVDLTVLGTLNMAETTSINSVENPEVGTLCQNLFDNYSSDKITVVKMDVVAGDTDETARVTASDTTVCMNTDGYNVIMIMAANLYKAGLVNDDRADNEGIYPSIQFVKAEEAEVGTVYMVEIEFLSYNNHHSEGE